MKFHLKSKMRINIPFLSFIFAKPHTHKKGVTFKYFGLQNSAPELTVELLRKNPGCEYLSFRVEGLHEVGLTTTLVVFLTSLSWVLKLPHMLLAQGFIHAPSGS